MAVPPSRCRLVLYLYRSCRTPLWCFENEQRSFVERDLCRQRRDLIAQAARAAEAERLVAQRVAQPLRGDAVGVAVHRQEGHEGADRSGERERSLSANGTYPNRAATRIEPDPVVARIGEKQKVRRLVVE